MRDSPSTTSRPTEIPGPSLVAVNFHALLIRLESRIRTRRLSPLTVTSGATSTLTFRSGSAALNSSTTCPARTVTSTSSRLISPLLRRKSIWSPSNTEAMRSLASRIFFRFAIVRLSSSLPCSSTRVLLRPSKDASGARRSLDTE